jgi:hypothetical protein
MRDIARELAIIKRLRARNKVPKSWIKYVQNLGSAPVVFIRVSSMKSQGQVEQAGAKPKQIK